MLGLHHTFLGSWVRRARGFLKVALVIWECRLHALLLGISSRHTCTQVCHYLLCKLLHLILGLGATCATKGEDLSLVSFF